MLAGIDRERHADQRGRDADADGHANRACGRQREDVVKALVAAHEAVQPRPGEQERHLLSFHHRQRFAHVFRRTEPEAVGGVELVRAVQQALIADRLRQDDRALQAMGLAELVNPFRSIVLPKLDVGRFDAPPREAPGLGSPSDACRPGSGRRGVPPIG